MGNLRTCFLVAPLALAACGGDGATQTDAAIDQQSVDAKVWMDAPPPMFNFTCMGNGMPSTATANVTLSGTVQRVSLGAGGISIDPLDGALVKACVAGAANCTAANLDGMDTSAGGGDFSIGPMPTGGTPLNDYLWMTSTGSRETFTYPASPFTADQAGIPILTFDPTIVSIGLPNFGCSQNDATNGMIGLAVTDCADMPITDSANLMLSVKQGGAEVTGTSMIDLGMISPMAAGVYLICNVPENATTTVDATYMSNTFREHDVKVVKGTTTGTLLRPGW